MFCPKCATANPEQAKFCRACGMNLETVALALTGQLVPGSKKEWLGKRSKGVRETVAGAILLGVSLLALAGFFLGALATGEFEVLAGWVATCSWMAIWGVIRLVRGLPDVIESKMMLRDMERIAGGPTAAPTAPLLSSAGGRQAAPGAVTAPEPVPPLSVTEHTTEALSEHRTLHPDFVPPKKEKA
jgi:hypothetical protein